MYPTGRYITVFESAARTAAINSADFLSYGHRGLILVIDATAETATASVTFTIQGKDALSGSYYTLLASAAIEAVGTTALTIYPGCVAVSNVVANLVLPSKWRVAVTVADTDSLTYSVGAELIP